MGRKILREIEREKPEGKKRERQENSRFMNVNELADYFDISPRTIYNQTGPKAKKPFPIKFKRIGGLIRFDKKDVDAYIDSL